MEYAIDKLEDLGIRKLAKMVLEQQEEIARLNKIIDELEKGLIYTLEYIIDIDKITIKEYNAIYKKATNIDYDFHISFEENIRRLKELKEESYVNKE